jgi:hypothetical protein
MMKPRGFRYVLESVHRLYEWDCDEKKLQLCAIEREISVQIEHEASLNLKLEQTRKNWLERVSQNRIDANIHRISQAYFLKLREQLQSGRQKTIALEEKRGEVIKQLVALRKYMNGLEEHRAEMVIAHIRDTDSKKYKQEDDTWLQRHHWSKT